ncbi:MAG: hypothetical protein AAGG48_16920 [Planctomycetota bacterium]
MTTDPGTLMWIGPRAREFAEPYEYCVSFAAQFAYRTDCEQALERRAVGVRGIVFARDDRSQLSLQSLEKLQRRYSAACCVHLLGAHSLGLRSGSDLPAEERVSWDRWRCVFPQWLHQWGAAPIERSSVSRSIVVVASNYVSAEPLIELADSMNASTGWIRSPDCGHLRNFDTVWWDDSIGTPVSVDQWRERIGSLTAANKSADHIWITNTATPAQYSAAKQAGITKLVTKPFEIESLQAAAPQDRALKLKTA